MPARPFEIDAMPGGLLAASFLGQDPAASLERRSVALWPSSDRSPDGHMSRTHASLARWVAMLRGEPYVGSACPAERSSRGTPDPGRPIYWVPSDTVVAPHPDWQLRSDDDLFGGVVPQAFVATKVVTHPLVSADASAPAGWAHDLGGALEDAVLPGHAVFDRDAAMRAGRRLLRDGPVRLKAASGIGGSGQFRIEDEAALADRVRRVDDAAWQGGWVLERDLVEPRTLSVGQVRLADRVASYVGTQRLTRDAQGRSVYGGSTLRVVPGGYDALASLALDDATQLAIQQARRYDERVKGAYPGTFATRSNYDVAQGFDHAGHWHSGVLEQSWRIGGATGAELIALQAFQGDPSLAEVDARTVEVYGREVELPPGAVLLYHGHDAAAGWLTKYAERIHRGPDAVPND